MNTIEAIYNYSSFGPFITVGGPGQLADAAAGKHWRYKAEYQIKAD